MPEANDTSPNAAKAGDQTRAALIKAGIKLFGTKGFEATSTREIAAAADVAEGTIYRHFADKTELFRAVFAEQQVWLDRNVQGVPTFVFNDKYMVTGAQEAETFKRLFDKLATEQAA